MILGIGTDITKVNRFEKWVKNKNMIERFFNEKEIQSNGTLNSKCQHYAVRFAAKEAFSKALGTGIVDFSLRDVFITKNELNKPNLNVINSAKKKVEEIYGNNVIFHVSLSHEKEYALAFVIIERVSDV